MGNTCRVFFAPTFRYFYRTISVLERRHNIFIIPTRNFPTFLTCEIVNLRNYISLASSSCRHFSSVSCAVILHTKNLPLMCFTPCSSRSSPLKILHNEVLPIFLNVPLQFILSASNNSSTSLSSQYQTLCIFAKQRT